MPFCLDRGVKLLTPRALNRIDRHMGFILYLLIQNEMLSQQEVLVSALDFPISLMLASPSRFNPLIRPSDESEVPFFLNYFMAPIVNNLSLPSDYNKTWMIWDHSMR